MIHPILHPYSRNGFSKVERISQSKKVASSSEVENYLSRSYCWSQASGWVVVPRPLCLAQETPGVVEADHTPPEELAERTSGEVLDHRSRNALAVAPGLLHGRTSPDQLPDRPGGPQVQS